MTRDIGHITQLHLNDVKNLPPLPEASVKIINAVNNPDVTVNELVETLVLTPSLVARLLGLANSAYFGQSGQIHDLRKAIIQVLGLNLVKSLSLSVALNVHLDASKCNTFDPHDYWWKSLSTALLGQMLCMKCKGDYLSAGNVYTAGLLLDIGILVAAFLVPEEMDRIFQLSIEQGILVHEEFSEAFGFSHYHLGYQLLNRWSLPQLYKITLKEFDNEDFNGEENKLIMLLRFCSQAVRLIDQGQSVDTALAVERLKELGLSKNDLSQAITRLEDSKQDIQELATIFGKS
jgi:HD-like signal output (HDOD) protein